MTKMQNLIDDFIFNQGARLEGRQGVLALCKVASVLGYKDPQRFGQLNSTDSIGQLINMLEDNPGMIEAMLNWIASDPINPDWLEAMKAAVPDQTDEDDDEDEFR